MSDRSKMEKVTYTCLSCLAVVHQRADKPKPRCCQRCRFTTSLVGPHDQRRHARAATE